MVEKKSVLSEGKAKTMYSTEQDDVLIMEFRDDITAFNAEKMETIEGKGALNHKVSEYLMHFLEEYGITVLRCSRIIETTPLECEIPQNNFLNGVLKIQTILTPHELLKLVKTIEHKLGRKKTVKNTPRPIDLDILLYDQLKYQSQTLTIPHPRMFERDFVMKPLKEIEPQISEEMTNANH